MKPRLFLFLLVLAAVMPASRATIIYSPIQNISVPLTPEGEYLRLDTGATAGTLPGDWETAPWINPFFGGVAVANSPLIRLVVTGPNQMLNLAPGTEIGAGSNFEAGEGVSSTHVGSGAGQFQLGVSGYVGFEFQTTIGGPIYYGWFGIEINNTGAGRIIDWAYDDSGAAIAAGFVPEPGAVPLCLAGLAVLTTVGRWRSRRFAF